MAIPNRISEVIPPAVLDSVTKKLADALTELKPYLIDALSKAEDDTLAKLGEKSEPYVEKGIGFISTNAQFVPSWVFPQEAKNDFGVFNDLRPIDILLQQLGGLVSSTRKVAGAEALAAINDFYKAITAAHKAGLAEATPIYEEMHKRYVDNGKRKKKSSEIPS